MRFHSVSVAALTACGMLASASVLHLDVSKDGNVAVDINTDGEPAPQPVRQGSKAAPQGDAHENAHSRSRGPGRTVRPMTLGEYQVDLYYEIHQGILSDDSKYIKFSNIPYAEPPVGDFRWAPPSPIYNESSEVNNGSQSRICPQMQVGWVPPAIKFLMDFANKTDKDLEKWKEAVMPVDYGDMPPPLDHMSEDCLLLDVFVPKSVWEKRNERSLYKSAVVAWIHGGGFIYGWKSQYGSPEGLFDAAEKDGFGNVIYVAMNYRLGAFGFLGGDKFQNDGGYGNAGLHDQKAALRWIQDYIHMFGGDRRRVSVMGQSAGASSILHHMTWEGGRYDPPFKSAILQSPGFFPQAGTAEADTTYTQFLEKSGAKNLDELLAKDTATLMKVNAEMTFASNYGYFKFGPTIDHWYVRDLPGKLLKEKRFTSKVPVLLGHTKYDGLLFTPPWVRSNSQLRTHIQALYPNMTKESLDKIWTLYPISLIDEKLKILGVSDLLDDVAIQCNNQWLTEAILETSKVPVYRYVFNMQPPIHGADVNYTYFPSKEPYPAGVDKDLAHYMQTAYVNFARYNTPNDENKEDEWPVYTAENRKVMNFGSALDMTTPSHNMGTDYLYTLGKNRCDFWQTAPFGGASASGSTFRDQTRGKKNDL